MRRIVIGLTICVVLALDWLALDDITTGREPSFVLEWTFLFISLPVLWALVRLGRSRGVDQRVV